MVKTKIIATLGPASSNLSVLRKMTLAGMDVVRLNFSHGSFKEHSGRITAMRNINRKYRRHIRLLGDLEGYRIRIGRIKDSNQIELKKGKILWLTQDNVIGDKDAVSFDYKGNLSSIKKGQHVYIDDGNIALVVEGHKKGSLKTRVVIGGILKEHKGVNIPGIKLKFKSITQKDKEGIDFCINNKFDYIAQSFVRNKFDILEVKKLLRARLPDCKVIAKIESREAIRNIDEIMGVSDGIMIARGDLGVSIPIYEVPVIQKEIIKKCNQKRKFVITATQMLESMKENHRPTRAEVADVSNAVFDGSDFLMLSAETAVGSYPVEAVNMMNQIIKFTEGYLSGGAKEVL